MHTASKNAGNQQNADNFQDLGCCCYWWGLRKPDKVFWVGEASAGKVDMDLCLLRLWGYVVMD